MDSVAVAIALLGALAILFGPAIGSFVLFARTRRLRAEVAELRSRLQRLEAAAAPRPFPVQPVADPSAAAPTPPIAPPVPRPRAPEPIVRPAAATMAAPAPEESLESRIGGRWLLNIGLAAIVVGVAYFEKLAIDNQWIGETARVLQGALLGAVLIAAGGSFTRRAYRFYGQMLAGGGVAILYLSTYAAFSYYHLIERPLAFGLMVAVTALGAFLADRQDSQGLAVLAAGGGFATPFLLPGNTDAQIALFTYAAIMIAGTLYLAQRRAWPLLNVVSYLMTLITVAGWADRFYTTDKYLRTEIYLTVYCLMFVGIARSSRRLASTFAEFAAWFVWTAPVAYYFASQVVLAGHPIALLVWLLCVALVGGALSVAAGGWSGFAVWLAAALPLIAFTVPPAGTRWLTQGLITVAAVYAIALAAQLRSAAEREPFTASDIAWIHLNALLMFAAAYLLLEPVRVAAAGPAAAAFAVWNGVLAGLLWTRDRDRAIHFTALALTLLAIAIALQFDGPAVIVGWAAEGAAVAALGLFERRTWLRGAGVVLFGIAVTRTIDLLMWTPPANYVVLLNPRAACAVLVIALCYGLAWLQRRDTAPARGLLIGSALLAAQVVTLVLLTTEIHAYFAVREAAFTRELYVSVTWAVYATALIVIGLQRRYAPVRYFAIGLFGITIAKVFFSDLAELDRIYRVISVIGLGMTLLLTSYLYQRMRKADLGGGPAN